MTRRKSLLILIVLLLSLFSVAFSSLPATGNETATLLLFDTSGSMDETDASGMTKMAAAIAAGRQIVNMIEAENRSSSGGAASIGVAHFSNTVDIDQALTEETGSAAAALDNLYSGGGTRMPDGMKLAIEHLSSQSGGKKPILVMLSDGLPTIGLGMDNNVSYEQLTAQVLAQADEAGRLGICIYTIGLGDPGTTTDNGNPSIDEELLREIPRRAGCGEYYNAQTAIQLANIYVDLRHASIGKIMLKQDGQINQGALINVGRVSFSANQEQVLCTLNWPGSKLELVMNDPAGNQVTTNYNGASISSSSTLETIVLVNPNPGDWQVSVAGIDVPEGTTYYHVVCSGREAPATAVPPATPTPGNPGGGGGLPLIFIIIIVAVAGIAFYIMRSGKSGKGLGSSGQTGAVLAGAGGMYNGQQFPVKASFTIGRGSNCDLRINSATVSRMHARINFASGAWRIYDLGSKAGTLVNGQAVQVAHLHSGDRIGIGETNWIFLEK